MTEKKWEVYSLPCLELPACFKWFLDIELAVIFGQWFLDIAVTCPVSKTATIGSDNSQTRHTRTQTNSYSLYFIFPDLYDSILHCECCQSQSTALFSHPSLQSLFPSVFLKELPWKTEKAPWEGKVQNVRMRYFTWISES